MALDGFPYWTCYQGTGRSKRTRRMHVLKTAFATREGLYELHVHGLCNAPATFQRLMDMVLADVKWSNYLVYIDDIYMVMGNTFQHLLQNLGLVLQKLTYGTGSPEKASLPIQPKLIL